MTRFTCLPGDTAFGRRLVLAGASALVALGASARAAAVAELVGADGRIAPGAAALGSALIWSFYSVLSRRFGAIGSDAVGGFCGATAVLAFVCHLALEPTVWPAGTAWLAILALGAGPVGLASSCGTMA